MTPQHPRIPRALILCGTLLTGLATTATAGPLERAQVNKIVNDVRIVHQQSAPRPAKVGDVVRDDVAVRTGTQSRAELLFQDQTLTRMGPDSLFSFKAGTREMTLDRGTMLLQVPKGLGGAQIRTAAVTAAITGTTIMLENAPDHHVKVVVLEGSLRLSMNKRFGGSVVLTPGKMVVLGAKETRLPKPVSVDLKRMVGTSALIDPKKFQGKSKVKVQPLPSVRLIEHEVSVQSAAKAASRLVSTGMEIRGNGTDIVGESGEKAARAGHGTSKVGRSGRGENPQTKAAQRSDVVKAKIVEGRKKEGGDQLGASISSAVYAANTRESKKGSDAKGGPDNGNSGKADKADKVKSNSGSGNDDKADKVKSNSGSGNDDKADKIKDNSGKGPGKK